MSLVRDANKRIRAVFGEPRIRTLRGGVEIPPSPE